MTENRLYRFLIPGSMFLLVYTALLAADPSISLRALFELTLSKQAQSFWGLAFAGGMLLIVVGYICSEILQVIGWPNPRMWWLKCTEQTSMRSAIGIFDEDDKMREVVTVFTHGPLETKYPGVKSYLQRSWSHILICWISLVALTGSYLAWVLTILRGSYLPRVDAFNKVSWFSQERFLSEQFRIIGSASVLIGLFIGLILFLSATREHRHRKRIYRLLTKLEWKDPCSSPK